MAEMPGDVTVHMYEDGVVVMDFPHACIVRDKRALMTDEEFWDDVYPQSDYEPVEPDMDCIGIDSPVPCPECGSTVACGYDELGRPMNHVVQEDDDGV